MDFCNVNYLVDGTEYDYVPIDFNPFGLRTIVQINGTEKLVFLYESEAPSPPISSELHIKHIPDYVRLIDLLPYFARFGLIYDARLMLEFNGKNRGFGFIRYCRESDAQKALLIMNTNGMILGKKVRVELSLNRSSLFVGNIPRHITYENVKKSLWRIIWPKFKNIIIYHSPEDVKRHVGFAILEFRSHEEAVEVKRKYNTGLVPLNIQDTASLSWAKPRRLCRGNDYQKPEDCYETLRLTCMANFLNIPIIIFGALCEEKAVQYCAIVLRSNITQIARAVFFEVVIQPGLDILSRISDIATILITLDEGFIKDNYIIKADINSFAFIVGVLQDHSRILKFLQPKEYDIDISFWHEIIDLRNAVYMISCYKPKKLLELYRNSLRYYPYLDNIFIYDRVLHCITSSYRSRPPMKCGITNDEILFLLCYRWTRKNIYYNRNILPKIRYTLIQDVHFNGRTTLYCASSLFGYDRVCLGSNDT